MYETTTTVDITLPLDLAEAFEQCAREEQITESELFQRIFRIYAIAKEEQRLEHMLLEGLASRSRTYGPQEWRELKERILASLGD